MTLHIRSQAGAVIVQQGCSGSPGALTCRGCSDGQSSTVSGQDGELASSSITQFMQPKEIVHGARGC